MKEQKMGKETSGSRSIILWALLGAVTLVLGGFALGLDYKDVDLIRCKNELAQYVGENK